MAPGSTHVLGDDRARLGVARRRASRAGARRSSWRAARLPADRRREPALARRWSPRSRAIGAAAQLSGRTRARVTSAASGDRVQRWEALRSVAIVLAAAGDRETARAAAGRRARVAGRARGWRRSSGRCSRGCRDGPRRSGPGDETSRRSRGSRSPRARSGGELRRAAAAAPVAGVGDLPARGVAVAPGLRRHRGADAAPEGVRRPGGAARQPGAGDPLPRARRQRRALRRGSRRGASTHGRESSTGRARRTCRRRSRTRGGRTTRSREERARDELGDDRRRAGGGLRARRPGAPRGRSGASGRARRSRGGSAARSASSSRSTGSWPAICATRSARGRTASTSRRRPCAGSCNHVASARRYSCRPSVNKERAP